MQLVLVSGALVAFAPLLRLIEERHHELREVGLQ